MRLEPGAHQRLDLDRADQRGGPRPTWPLWARWNDELGQRYTLGVEEELMLLDAARRVARAVERRGARAAVWEALRAHIPRDARGGDRARDGHPPRPGRGWTPG